MKSLFIVLVASIVRVFEFCPAPGQYTNSMPAYETGDDAATMAAKAEACLANHHQEMVSLGGWGGYIVFGFDHSVVNLAGEYDLKILGNAFYGAVSEDSLGKSGSSEPGIVMVSRDVNGNGLPDDPWYELAGSEYNHPLTRHSYSLTYYRPDEHHVATPDSAYPYLTDTTYIRWRDSEGNEGYVAKNSFHQQAYYPQWVAADSITYVGSRLPDNSVRDSTGAYYASYCYEYGYVDDQPNEVVGHPEWHASEFMIDWAVDANGQHVWLDAIDFVKVYTGTNQYNGWLGESSTEILDAWDMHAEREQAVATFEEADITPLDADSVWMPTQSCTFRSGTYAFQSSVQDYGVYGVYYYGFAVSNQTDTTYAYYADAYKSAAGGAYDGANYAVWYADYYQYDHILLSKRGSVSGCYVTNTTWVVNSIRVGDAFTGPYSVSDWLKLTAYGWRDGEVVDSVSFYLARDGEVLCEWAWMDLSSLGEVDALSFAMTGSKTNGYGLVTPTYFCMDNLGGASPTEQGIRGIDSGCGIESEKVLYDGSLYIRKQGVWYSLLGVRTDFHFRQEEP